jgi:hypothetical protein
MENVFVLPLTLPCGRAMENVFVLPLTLPCGRAMENDQGEGKYSKERLIT